MEFHAGRWTYWIHYVLTTWNSAVASSDSCGELAATGRSTTPSSSLTTSSGNVPGCLLGTLLSITALLELLPCSFRRVYPRFIVAILTSFRPLISTYMREAFPSEGAAAIDWLPLPSMWFPPAASFTSAGGWGGCSGTRAAQNQLSMVERGIIAAACLRATFISTNLLPSFPWLQTAVPS